MKEELIDDDANVRRNQDEENVAMTIPKENVVTSMFV